MMFKCDATAITTLTTMESLSYEKKSKLFYPMEKPEWLKERNNDPYGTPNNHEFWDSVEVTSIGGMKVFEKDGWRVFDPRHNAWYTLPNQLDAMIHATKLTSSSVRDPWN